MRLKLFNLLEPYKRGSLKSFHLAEGPGGFIEATNYMRGNSNDLYYGMTLIDENNLTSLSQADCHKDNDVNFSCIQELI